MASNACAKKSPKYMPLLGFCSPLLLWAVTAVGINYYPVKTKSLIRASHWDGQLFEIT